MTPRIRFQCTFHILHDHAEMAPGFKRAKHGDHKWVLGKGEDVPFYKSLLDLVPQHQVLTVYLFHGEPLAGLLMADQIHSPANTHTGFGKVCYVHTKQ